MNFCTAILSQKLIILLLRNKNFIFIFSKYNFLVLAVEFYKLYGHFFISNTQKAFSAEPGKKKSCKSDVQL